MYGYFDLQIQAKNTLQIIHIAKRTLIERFFLFIPLTEPLVYN